MEIARRGVFILTPLFADVPAFLLEERTVLLAGAARRRDILRRFYEHFIERAGCDGVAWRRDGGRSTWRKLPSGIGNASNENSMKKRLK